MNQYYHRIFYDRHCLTCFKSLKSQKGASKHRKNNPSHKVVMEKKRCSTEKMLKEIINRSREKKIHFSKRVWKVL